METIIQWKITEATELKVRVELLGNATILIWVLELHCSRYATTKICLYFRDACEKALKQHNLLSVSEARDSSNDNIDDCSKQFEYLSEVFHKAALADRPSQVKSLWCIWDSQNHLFMFINSQDFRYLTTYAAKSHWISFETLLSLRLV